MNASKRALAASVLLFACAGILPPAHGALPPRSPDDLDRAATLILQGNITRVTEHVDGRGEFRNRIHSLSVRITRLTKGVVPAPNITVRAWTIESRPRGFVGPAGHHSIPKAGDVCELWLKRDEGGFWVPLEPNGIRILGERPIVPEPDPVEPVDPEKRMIGRGWVKVSAGAAKLRTENNFQSSSLGFLKKGDILKVDGTDGEWRFVRVHSGSLETKVGWVYSSQIAPNR